jgi:putative DNA primase/helicase
VPEEQARDIVASLPAQAKADHGAPFEPEVVGALAVLREKKLADYVRLREELKASGVSVGKLDAALAEHQRQHLRVVASDDPVPLTTVGEALPDAPQPELVVPASYILRPDATIQIIHTTRDGRTEREIAFAPVVISARLRDEDENTESLRLAYRRSDGWRELVVDRAIALDGRQIVALASRGFPVASDNAHALAHYLHVFEATNHSRLPCHRVSSHLGWQGPHGEAGFLWGREHLAPPGWNAEPITFRGLDVGDEQIADGYHAAGTLKGWLAAIKRVLCYPRVCLALYTSLAPPLLRIVEAPNFIADWANRTSTGKTTALRVGASAWGNPDERAAATVLASWDASRVWVERASGLLSGIPLFLDDTKRAKHPKMVSELLYTVAGGRGRGRGNTTSLAATGSWRTVLLSSGEAPATSFSQEGGTRMRCLEVRGVPFEKQDAKTAKVVERVNAEILANYGHAGPAFVRHLLQTRKHWPDLRARYQAAKELYAAKNGRLAGYMGVNHLAAEIFHEIFGLQKQQAGLEDVLGDLWTAVAAEAEDAAGDLRALRDVVSWAHAHQETFWGRHQEVGDNGDVRVPAWGWSGQWLPATGLRHPWKYLAFYQPVLQRVLRELGYEPEGILSSWKERGWIATDGDRQRYTKRIRVNGVLAHLVAIRRRAIQEQCGEGGDV